MILAQIESQKGCNDLCIFGCDYGFLFSCEMKFSMELTRSCYLAKQGPLLCSIFQSFTGLWVNIWHGTKRNVLTRNWILCTAADLTWNGRPVQEKGVCSESNQTAQLLQIVECKSLEMMCDMMLYRQQPKFAAKSFANAMQCLKAILWPALARRASIFDLKFFSAICPYTVLLTNHPLLDLGDLS